MDMLESGIFADSLRDPKDGGIGGWDVIHSYFHRRIPNIELCVPPSFITLVVLQFQVGVDSTRTGYLAHQAQKHGHQSRTGKGPVEGMEYATAPEFAVAAVAISLQSAHVRAHVIDIAM